MSPSGPLPPRPCGAWADGERSVSPPLDDAATVAYWVADRLEEHGLAYAIGGALALAAHGVPRMTNDADLAVYLDGQPLEVLFAPLERAGCIFDRAAAKRDVERANLFTVKCGLILVDLFISFHPLHDDARSRRQALVGPDGRRRWFLSPEDLAVHKLALCRGKDRVDLERLFAARGPALDVAYIRHWIDRIIPEAEDPRRATLDDLVRRFAPR